MEGALFSEGNVHYRIVIESFYVSAASGALSNSSNGLNLATQNVSQGRVNWPSFAPHALNLGSISRTIGRTIQIGGFNHTTLVIGRILKIFRFLYMRSFVMDGNFKASHLRQRRPEDDVCLTRGTGMMAERETYAKHLKIASNDKAVCSVTYDCSMH